jgi:hypothetical protein
MADPISSRTCNGRRPETRRLRTGESGRVAAADSVSPSSSRGLSNPPQILVNDGVAHCPHLRPWQLGMLIDEVAGDTVDVVDGLADDFDIADYRILHLRVLLEFLNALQRLRLIPLSQVGQNVV